MKTLDEAIARYNNNAEYERTHGNLQGCLEFRQLAEWLEQLKQIKDIVARHDAAIMKLIEDAQTEDGEEDATNH